MDKSDCKIAKVFTAKWRGHSYYVQCMPGIWGIGRDFAVMKDRRRLYSTRFTTEKEAVKCIMDYLIRELTIGEIEFPNDDAAYFVENDKGNS